jgi:hypothetical protein
MPRGGYRPGSGAKPGNLNALKEGQHSAQLHELESLLARHPEVREYLVHFAHRQAKRQREAEQIARAIFKRFFPERARLIEDAKPAGSPLTLSLSKGTAQRSRPLETTRPARKNDRKKRTSAWQRAIQKMR